MAKSFRELAAPINANPERRLRVAQYRAAMEDACAVAELRQHDSACPPACGDTEGEPGRSPRLERQANVYLDTLEEYVRELGGRLTLLAEFDDGDVRLERAPTGPPASARSR